MTSIEEFFSNGLPHVADAQVPYAHARSASGSVTSLSNGVSLISLMDLDDVALWVIEEDLIPPFHRPSAVVRVWNAFLVESLLECGNIVGPKRDMAAFQRVDSVLMAKADA